MNIVHPSGECFDVPLDALSINRTNPFFNTIGEQSLPVDLPASARNMRLCGYPSIASVKKLQSQDVMIESGVYSTRAKQVILKTDESKIKCSFYLNEGAFYSKMRDVSLQELLKDEVKTFTNLANLLNYLYGCITAPGPSDFCVFPVAIRGEGSEYKYLNMPDFSLLNQHTGTYEFYNAIDRSETVDGKTVQIAAGYYISPFIKARYLLHLVFKKMGYTFNYAGNIFFNTPFDRMVFLNTNIDTIVKNEIRLSQVVPSMSVSELLNVFRNRFNGEFIPNENSRTVEFVLFDSMSARNVDIDLEPFTINAPEVSYQKQKRLKLSCDRIDGPSVKDYTPESLRPSRFNADYRISEDKFDSIKDLILAYPEAQLSPIDGAIYRRGFKGAAPVVEQLGTLTIPYCGEDNELEIEEKKAADPSPGMLLKPNLTPSRPALELCPFVGEGRSINSVLVWDGEDASSVKKDKSELKAMLCFAHYSSTRKYCIGTIYNLDEFGNKIWDYSLSFNGEYGLYERFWRGYDNMIRNSSHEVSIKAKISDVVKFTLPSIAKIHFANQHLLLKDMKYDLKRNSLVNLTCLTSKLYEPISSSVPEADRLKVSSYYWEAGYTTSNSAYPYYKLKGDIATEFYLPPTKEQYDSGLEYHKKTVEAILMKRSVADGVEPVGIDGTVTFYLRARMQP